jgi:hypothetical protein
MTDKYPFNFVVSKLFGANFTSMVIDLRWISRTVLCANHNMILNSSFGQVNVKHARQYDEIEFLGVVLKNIDHIVNDVSDEISRSIALPVGDDAVLAFMSFHSHFKFFDFFY